MRRCISEPTIRFPRPAPRSVATSAFTTPGALIRALTGRRQTMLTSLACRTSRQPEPGRRSTYQNRNAVQTNRATAMLAREAALMGVKTLLMCLDLRRAQPSFQGAGSEFATQSTEAESGLCVL